jgi:hypothetical protein
MAAILSLMSRFREEDRYRSVTELLDNVRASETGRPVNAQGLG